MNAVDILLEMTRDQKTIGWQRQSVREKGNGIRWGNRPLRRKGEH